MGRPLYKYIINNLRVTAKVSDAEPVSLTLKQQTGKARFVVTDGNNEFVINLVDKQEFLANKEMNTGYMVAKVGEEEFSVNFFTDKLVFVNENDNAYSFKYDLVKDKEGRIVGICQVDESEVVLDGMPEELVIEDGKVSVNDATLDAVIDSAELTKTSSMKVKSAKLSNVKGDFPAVTSGAALFVEVADNASIEGSDLKFDNTNKTNGVTFSGPKSLVIRDTTFNGKTYNTIMTGQNQPGTYNSILIENCLFEEVASHVSVWLASMADNAVLTIKNCKFLHSDDAFIVSNATNSSNVTINIEDCVIADCYNEDDGYAGWLLFQDYSSASEEASIETNMFGPDKMTVNLKNVSVRGKVLNHSTLKVGTLHKDQDIYVYRSKGGLVAFDPEFYPTIHVM